MINDLFRIELGINLEEAHLLPKTWNNDSSVEANWSYQLVLNLIFIIIVVIFYNFSQRALTLQIRILSFAVEKPASSSVYEIKNIVIIRITIAFRLVWIIIICPPLLLYKDHICNSETMYIVHFKYLVRIIYLLKLVQKHLSVNTANSQILLIITDFDAIDNLGTICEIWISYCKFWKCKQFQFGVFFISFVFMRGNDEFPTLQIHEINFIYHSMEVISPQSRNFFALLGIWFQLIFCCVIYNVSLSIL